MEIQTYGVKDAKLQPLTNGRMLLETHGASQVELGRDTYRVYQRLVEAMRDRRGTVEIAARMGVAPEQVLALQERFAGAGLLFREADQPKELSGPAFYERYFAKALPLWLDQAFSHPFWDRMRNGQGSARLFAGWLFELFHYTKNANRHMPLACAHAEIKAIKSLRAKHYAEEWNHYHYFSKSLKAMGFTRQQVEQSEPLPMTLEMSNYMRQAARTDVLAYSACSAVLEGTTIGEENYDGYYSRCVELYGVPKAAVEPIYDHLALDRQYDHSDLFAEILSHVGSISAERASKVLEHGRQLVEHIWLWTDEIERYYGNENNPIPRPVFDLIRD